MFNAQLLFGTGGGANVTKVYSPWFPRQGDNIIATVETVNSNGLADTDFVVKVLTKASDQTTDGTAMANTINAGTEGRESVTNTGCNELVRYAFEVTGETSDWVLFRMLPPVWFDTVDAS